MKRNKKNKTEKEVVKSEKPKMEKSNLVRFRKDGGGSLRIKGRIIKPGQVVEINPADIPSAFRDTLIPIANDARTLRVIAETEKTVKKEVKVPEKEVVIPVYSMVKNEELSTSKEELFDIFDGENKLISEEGKPLAKDVAEETLKALK